MCFSEGISEAMSIAKKKKKAFYVGDSHCMLLSLFKILGDRERLCLYIFIGGYVGQLVKFLLVV